jgi:uncharacterized repeat protein (TIGR01451 family)
MQIGKRLRRHSRLAGVGTVAVVVFALAASVAWATGTLDQQNPGPSDSASTLCGNGRLGQTFTAGLTGALDTVQLGLFREENTGETPGALVVSIEGTNSLANPGTPDDGDVLATQTVPAADIADRSDFDTIQAAFNNVETIVFDNPAQVVAGTKYAIVLAAPDCVFPEHGSNGYSFTYPEGGTQTSTYSGGDPCELSAGVWDCGTLNPGDHTFATYVTVTPPPPSADVAVGITGPTSAKKGALVSYVITVSNAGPDTAHNVVLTDPVPSGASFVGVSSTKGSCTPPRRGGPIACALGDLGASSNALSSVSVRVIAKAGSNIANVLSAQSTANGAGGATPDPQPSNNSASLSTTITK